MTVGASRWVALVIGLTAGTVAYLAAQPYPGATVDSGEYLAVADGFAAGHGLTMPYVGYDEPFQVLEGGERVPLTQFPPLYPALLSVAHQAGFSLLDGARMLGALCFAATAALAGLLVARATGKLLPALILGGLVLTADLVTIHAMVWSETVMLTALLATVLFTLRYLRDSGWTNWFGAAAFAIIASGARFVGLAAAFAAAIVIATGRRERPAARLVRAVAFLGVTLVPTVVWFIRNASILGTPSEKELGTYVPGLAHLRQGLSTFGGWVVPWQALQAVVGAILLVAIIGIVGRSVRRSSFDISKLQWLCTWFAIAYLGVVLTSRTFLDQNIAFDFRILSPAYVLLAIAVTTAAASRGTVALAFVGVLAGLALVRGSTTMVTFSSSSVAAYTGDDWRNSPTLRYAGAASEDTMLITNAPDPIWIWHRKPSTIIPPRSSLYSGEPNAAYSRDVAEIHAATRCRDAIVVFFDQPTRKPRRYIEPLLVRGLGLSRIERFIDGEIYEVTEPRCEAEA